MKKVKQGYFYIAYLTELKNRVFKIIPLFVEEKNSGVYKHIDTVFDELLGLKDVFERLEAKDWYISTLATLKTFKNKKLGDRQVRSEVLRLLNLIDKEIERRG